MQQTVLLNDDDESTTLAASTAVRAKQQPGHCRNLIGSHTNANAVIHSNAVIGVMLQWPEVPEIACLPNDFGAPYLRNRAASADAVVARIRVLFFSR